MGALAALEARRRTGRGQVVDASIFESVLAVTESLVVEWCAHGTVRERTGPTLPGIAPSNVYPTSDGQILIAANQDSVFRRLVDVMGMPELATDPRFVDHRARGRNMARDRHHHRGLDGALRRGGPARPAARGRACRRAGSTSRRTCSTTRISSARGSLETVQGRAARGADDAGGRPAAVARPPAASAGRARRSAPTPTPCSPSLLGLAAEHVEKLRRPRGDRASDGVRARMNVTAPAAMTLADQQVFRDVIGRFASGVTMITTTVDGAPFGTTASAVSSLSLEPPMVLVCLNKTSDDAGRDPQGGRSSASTSSPRASRTSPTSSRARATSSRARPSSGHRGHPGAGRHAGAPGVPGRGDRHRAARTRCSSRTSPSPRGTRARRSPTSAGGSAGWRASARRRRTRAVRAWVLTRRCRWTSRWSPRRWPRRWSWTRPTSPTRWCASRASTW